MLVEIKHIVQDIQGIINNIDAMKTAGRGVKPWLTILALWGDC